MLNQIDRRRLLVGASWATPLAMGLSSRILQGQTAEDKPHFFLNLFIRGGMDPTYTFDARPLSLTDQGKVQNYLYRNSRSQSVLADPQPRLLVGENGERTLRTPLTDKLSPFFQDMAIVNGLMMAVGNIAHFGNGNYLYNGVANRADSFLPILGQAKSTPMESIYIGNFAFASPANFNNSIRLDPGQGSRFIEDVIARRRAGFDEPFWKFVEARLRQGGSGRGLFSAGVEQFYQAYRRSPNLAQALAGSALADEEGDSVLPVDKPLQTALGYFSTGISRVASIQLSDWNVSIDSHGVEQASNSRSHYDEILENIARLLRTLKETPFGNGESFLDVTTVMIASEFTRTLRQVGLPIDATGTDHNNLTNTVLLAGKGIRGGSIIGSSDLSQVTAEGDFADVSGAHRSRDNRLIRAMGRPFDFATGRSREDLPAEFKSQDYLHAPSLANTLMELFGVEKGQHFELDGRKAPLIGGLLK